MSSPGWERLLQRNQLRSAGHCVRCPAQGCLSPARVPELCWCRSCAGAGAALVPELRCCQNCAMGRLWPCSNARLAPGRWQRWLLLSHGELAPARCHRVAGREDASGIYQSVFFLTLAQPPSLRACIGTNTLRAAACPQAEVSGTWGQKCRPSTQHASLYGCKERLNLQGRRLAKYCPLAIQYSTQTVQQRTTQTPHTDFYCSLKHRKPPLHRRAGSSPRARGHLRTAARTGRPGAAEPGWSGAARYGRRIHHRSRPGEGFHLLN